ncbi:cytochrome c oxidase accessory protein CcoG [Marinospirillum perlucidum]|uniref:cytochrome c oxidase accessory protein CcoG n=1 Tax=Marinospirillum perlucidum TaxID=1982602 RepID=UPI000DF299B8|nr:cytochrome c oxidase accessory protein CcoG [Marinospirillum perlucidum]
MQSPSSKFHVRLTPGRMQNWRRLISWPLLIAFFSLVWITYDGRPLLLFDFEQRRLLVFASHFSWQDLPILTGFLIAAAALLFFMAMGWGRIWCGFACPQSCWTWIFLRIENWLEGSAKQRAQADQYPLTGQFLLRRLTKHLLWIAVALATSLTFTGYFIPIRELLAELVQLQASPAVWIWVGSMALLTYLNAGLVREQICLHACPYSRFQGVMMDADTRKVSYDFVRGEPRGRGSRKKSQKDKGSCVDCDLCVQVCPTGIDIRKGSQAACIDCGACIDACDQVMDKTGQARGLIRFASEAEIQGKFSPFWRPRLVGYGLVCLLALMAAGYGLSSKKELVAEIRRERGQLYRILGNDQLCNFYHIKLEAFHPRLQTAEVRLVDQPDFSLQGPQQLRLDNRGDWVAYRICTDNLQASGGSMLLEFHADSVVLSKKTSFISQNRAY